MQSIQPDGILETALYADDLVAAERFYRELIGLKVIAKEKNRHVFFACGTSMLLVFNPKMSARPPVMGARTPVPPHGMTGKGHVCFRAYANEIPLWVQRMKAARIKIEADFQWPMGGRSVYVRDPAGNSVEFAEPRIWPLG